MWKTFSSSKNIQIAYNRSQNLNRETIVIVHGMAFGSKHIKSHIENCLAKNYNLVFYDQRFCGKSAQKNDRIDSKNISISTFIDDLENLRIELKLKKLNLLGHGWGGRLSVEYALNFPKNINSVILISPQSLHFSFYNVRLVNLAKKYSQQNLDPQKLFKKYNIFVKYPNVENAKNFYQDFFKLFFYDLTKNGRSSEIDFTFDDLTAERIFQIQNFLYNSLGKINYEKNPSIRSDGENKNLDNFPHVPILLIHGSNDIDSWQYTLGNYEETKNPTKIKANLDGDIYQKAKADGICFGQAGVSYLEKLKEINFPKEKIFISKLDKCGYWPFIESQDEFSNIVFKFFNSIVL